MSRLLVLLLALALPATTAAATASAPKIPGGVSACLSGHQVMATPSRVKIVAPKSPQLSSMGVSFALISGLELNSGSLAFERNAAVATRVGNEWLAYQLARYKKAGLRVTAAMVKLTYFVKDNVVVIWANEPGSTTAGRARARRILTSCI